MLSACLLLTATQSHMPAFAGTTSRVEPLDLGDITKNSWALTGTLSPGEVQHYKFTIADATPTTSTDRFYMGLYVPGAGEDDFRFYVAIFGLGSETECERWGDGWGRRRLVEPAMHGRALVHPKLPVHRKTSDGTTWLAASDTSLPVEVVGNGTEDLPVDYNNTAERLIFIADPGADLPIKFEPFSPTLFRPRGSCIVDFPRSGEYRIAVWGDETMVAERRFSVGLGLKERDVFSPSNLLLFDFTLMRIQAWNGWNPFVLLLPILASLFVLFIGLHQVSKKRPGHFGTTSGWPTPFRTIAAISGTMFLGHMVANVMILVWAVTSADPHGEYMFPLMTGIVLPIINGITTLLIGLRIPCCCCCCPGAPSAKVSCGQRLAVLPAAILHLMLHAGYIIAPALLLVAAILPSSVADVGIAEDGEPKTKTMPKTDVEAVVASSVSTEVAATPPVMSTL